MRQMALIAASAAVMISCGPKKSGGGDGPKPDAPELATFTRAHVNDRTADEINGERELVLNELKSLMGRIPDCNDGGDGKLGPTRGIEDGYGALMKLIGDNEWKQPKPRERQEVKLNDEPQAFALSVDAMHSYENGQVGIVQKWRYGANDDFVFASFAQDGAEGGVDAQVQWTMEFDKKSRVAEVRHAMRSSSFGLDQTERVSFDGASVKISYELVENVDFTASYVLNYKGTYTEADNVVTGAWSAERTGYEPTKRGATTLWDRKDECLKIRTATKG